ncbi:type VI secretion system baseplate subunit TssG, partial [Burkholderia pseudomallei]
EYRQLLPGGVHARQLEQGVREYVGIEFDWAVQLELARGEVPTLALGSRHGLGLTAWLGERLGPGPARDLELGYDERMRASR